MIPNGGRADFDPESLFDPNNIDNDRDSNPSIESSEEDETPVNGSREHYVDVGTSKLRKPKTAALGPQYRGLKVSRGALSGDEEEENDPFGMEFESEGSEDEDDEDMDDETDATDLSGVDDGAGSFSVNFNKSSEDRSELLKTVAKKSERSVATSLAQSARADAQKGAAVKRQQAAFDSLLNTRIKMQKTLVGVNTIVGTPSNTLGQQRPDASNAIEAAETAAFNLWSSLNDFREDLIGVRTGQKRKRNTFTVATTTSDLWTHTQAQEESTVPHRNATLNRWSAKTKSATALPERGLINKSESQSTLVEALQSHLQDRSRLLKKAQTPGSCAPLQLSRKMSHDENIYDDAEFYGLLLKELLEQKSQNSLSASASADIDFGLDVRREAKAKKQVDTKASKGRKLRHTVHEKLQNFMAPEDRGSWGARQSEELFGGLFGRRMVLGEEVEQDAEGGGEEGLILFRS